MKSDALTKPFFVLKRERIGDGILFQHLKLPLNTAVLCCGTISTHDI